MHVWFLQPCPCLQPTLVCPGPHCIRSLTPAMFLSHCASGSSAAVNLMSPSTWSMVACKAQEGQARAATNLAALLPAKVAPGRRRCGGSNQQMPQASPGVATPRASASQHQPLLNAPWQQSPASLEKLPPAPTPAY